MNPEEPQVGPNDPGYDPRMQTGGIGTPAGGQATSVHGRTWEELAVAEDAEAWRARSRIVLSPMAAPSIIGLTGFAIATLMVGAWQAGWYGTAHTPLVLWPFALIAGGIMQGIAAFLSLRARDGVAGCVHTAWGAFWVGWGTMQILVATGTAAPIPLGATNASFAFWWIALAIFTGSAALAALGQSLGIFTVLSPLATGAGFTAAGFYGGALWALRVGGWLFVVAAAAAWLVVTAMMLENAFGRTIIPLGKWSAAANIPGKMPTRPMAYEGGMPGVRVGQ